MLTDEQIAELRRLLDAATKGEWMLGQFGGVYPVEPGYGIIARSGSKHGSGKLDVENEKLIVALRNAAPALLSAHDDAVRLRVEADMLQYVFHHMGESWMPRRVTYGQWKGDLYRLMVDRGFWTRGVPEYPALRPAGQGGA